MKNEDFEKVLGKISIFFATLDFLSSRLIVELDIQDVEKLFKSNATLNQKFGLLNKLTETQVKQRETFKKLKEILPKAIDLSEQRNRFIHDQWVFNPNNISEGKIERIEIVNFHKSNFKIQKTIHTIENLYALLGEIGKIQIQIGNLLNEIKTIHNNQT